MSANQNERGVTRQEFGGERQLAKSAETAQAMMAESAKTQMQAHFAIAKQFPRSIEQVRVEILQTCDRPRFAAGARYAKPITGALSCKNPLCPLSGVDKDGVEKTPGKPVKCGFVCGLNVKASEEFARIMKNILIQQNTVYEDDQKRIAGIAVVDLENNIPRIETVNIAKSVERSYLAKGREVLGERINSYGDKVYIVYPTPDEFENKAASACSKVRRNLELKMLPQDIRAEAEDRIMEVTLKEDAKNPDENKRKLIDAFARLGVTPLMLEAWLKHSIDQVVPAEISLLRRIWEGIDKGEATWAGVMEAREAESADSAEAPPESKAATDAVKEKIAAAKEKAAPRKPKAEAPPPPPADLPANACPEYKKLVALEADPITAKEVQAAIRKFNLDNPGTGLEKISQIAPDDITSCQCILNAMKAGKKEAEKGAIYG